MKVALVHDYLNQYGGGERVLETLMEMFPEAPVYTLFYDKEKTGGRFDGRVARTSFLDFPLARKNHRLFIPFMPLAASSLNLGDKYDLIISDTAGFAKGIRYDAAKTKHLSYIHTPLRYAWEQENYLGAVLSKANLFVSKPLLNYLKKWDYRAGQKPDTLLANSKFIAGKIKNYYGRDSVVAHPPVDGEKFYREIAKGAKPLYYLAVGRLLHYKRFDLVVEAFAKLGLPLKIVGVGPEMGKLVTRAFQKKAKNIEFLSFVDNEHELRQLYNGAKALIFPQVEDFGLVAAEAQACGVPVIAYAAGGATEIVEDGVSGVLFNRQTPEAIAAAVQSFESIKFSRPKIAKLARRFSKENFRQAIFDAVGGLC